ncbi:MAG: hypothetical protein LBT16_07255 [Treponema sp.]|jgi:hypothetical protein|nr:hypothetical protein [Treponema sp.]
MRKNGFVVGILVLILAAGLVLTGCANPSGGDGSTGSGSTGSGSTGGSGTLTINNISSQNGKYAFAYAENAAEEGVLCIGSFGATEDAPLTLVQVKNGSVTLKTFDSDGGSDDEPPPPFTGSGSYTVYVLFNDKSNVDPDEIVEELVLSFFSEGGKPVTFTNGSATLKW